MSEFFYHNVCSSKTRKLSTAAVAFQTCSWEERPILIYFLHSQK
jgi:hypothetical protein